MSDPTISRRKALALAAGAAGAVATGAKLPTMSQEKPKASLKQSVCRWCFGGIALDDLCVAGKDMGLVGIDLLSEGDFATVKKHGLVCTMALGITTIEDGWNRVENHDRFIKDAERLIPIIAENGFTNAITFSGNRAGMDDATGMDNCAKGLERVMATCDKHGVTLHMELLNSKRMHKDYMCDHTDWGVGLCKKLGSDKFKLLYDVFHMQIMEGDLCDTIRENIAYIGHFHTGGVPGRHEIDASQEINYHRVCQTILDTGFQGFFAHEFIPERDALTSLREAVKLCSL